MRFRLSICVTAAALAAIAPTLSAVKQAPYSRIVVFGTSLSDSGNAFALVGGTSTPPDYTLSLLLIPSAPFARGGHHFSNGQTWVEQLAQSLGLAGSVRPAYASSSEWATNYAVGGARARDFGDSVNLADQVNDFLADFGGVAPADALYVLEMGSIDVFDAIAAFQTGGAAASQAILQQAIASIAAAIQTLYAAGARQFLVWRVPDAALTPAIQTLNQVNPGLAQVASGLTTFFNTGLDAVLAQLSAALPGISIARLDAFALLHQIVLDPTAFGLTDATSACVTPNVPPFFCQNPDEFLFWDGIHPSRATHALTAQEAARVLLQ